MNLLKQLLEMHMLNETGLTDVQKHAILLDFSDWSGGYNPDEVHKQRDGAADDLSIAEYLEDGLATEYDSDVVSAWFQELCDLSDAERSAEYARLGTF